MFEKEAEEWRNSLNYEIDNDTFNNIVIPCIEFGFNKANEWHYVKDELPKVSGRYWVYTGGEPFTLDFDTEVNAFGYWCAVLSGSFGVCDTVFETVEERKEDEVIAWKEIVLPKESV